jgi:putative membrane protein
LPASADVLLAGWSTAPALWLALLEAVALYTYGVHTLHDQGRRWNRWRRVSYAGGLLAIAVALVSPLAAHDEQFAVHMVQHMLLGMLGPLLLAFSAPITLRLRVLRPRPRRRLVWLLHSPAVRVLANPLTATTLFVVGLYAVYFTPVYDATLRHPCSTTSCTSTSSSQAVCSPGRLWPSIRSRVSGPIASVSSSCSSPWPGTKR